MRNPTTKILLAGLVLLAGSPSGISRHAFADAKPASPNVHAEPITAEFCANVKAFAGDAVLLDSSRLHVDDARVGFAVPCDGWVSVRTGWIELKHRDGHMVRLGENSFVQFNGEQESLTLLRGLIHVQAFDDGADLRMVTPNARARMKQGSGILLYSPERQRSQWVTLSRLAVLENRFEPESQMTVAEGEGSVLDLARSRVTPAASRAVTVASLKPLLKSLDLPEKVQKGAIQVALIRQRRAVPAILGEGGLLAGSHPVGQQGHELRSPASIGGRARKDRALYERHSNDQKDAKIERHLAQKQTGGAPTTLLEPAPEALEKRLEAKSAASEQREKIRVIEGLDQLDKMGDPGRFPASESE